MAKLQIDIPVQHPSFGDTPSSTNQSAVADIEFIFSEWIRFNDLISKDFRSVPVEDMRCSLRSPREKDHGSQLIFGRLAFARISALATLVGKSSKLQHRVSHDLLQSVLANVLLDRFFKNLIPITQRNADRALSAAGKIAKSKLTTKTHFVPCHLMHIQEPPLIQIGPVIFATRQTFRKGLVGLAKSYRRNLVDDRKHRAGIFADVLDYYRSFKWVGGVTIRDCDKKTSEKYATAAITAGLDCLHLLFEAGYTDRMRVGGPKITADVRGKLHIAENGALEVSWSRSVVDQVNFGEGWSGILIQPDMANMLVLCGTALESIVDPELERSLSLRFLDTAHWYGEAARDSSDAARVVKYVTALERMLMTDEMNDIASIVSRRASYFFANAHDQAARTERMGTIKKLYDLRSRLVHGSISPRSPTTRKGAAVAAKIASETVLWTLFAIGQNNLLATNVSNKRYAKWFDLVSARYDASATPSCG